MVKSVAVAGVGALNAAVVTVQRDDARRECKSRGERRIGFGEQSCPDDC